MNPSTILEKPQIGIGMPMNQSIRPHRAALVMGLLLGTWHALWSLIVAIGAGQAVLNFIFWLHFMANPLVVTGFSLSRAAMLVGLTFCIGYAGGWFLAAVWNRFHDRRRWWQLPE